MPSCLVLMFVSFPFILRVKDTDAYPQIVFSTIIATVIITTIGLAKAGKNPPQGITDDKINTQ